MSALAAPAAVLGVDGWLHPALAGLTALAAVPIAIHLLNRQRHRPMAWAAMRFVQAAYKRTRRRARLEELLLLLLRAGAVALLALALARPFAGAESPLSSLTERRRDVVLLLDGSASTGYRESVDSVFDRIVARAREVLSDLDSERGDRARLILAGDHPRLLSWRTPDEALSVLATLTEPTDERLDLAAALADVRSWAEDEAGVAPGSIELLLLTDLQRSDFLPPVGAAESAGAGGEEAAEDAPGSSLSAELDRLEELGLVVRVEDLGPAELRPPNLGLAAVEPLSAPLGPGSPFEVAVDVANYGPVARAGVRVVLVEDGERRPVQTIEVPARGQARAIFPVVPESAGPHTLEASIEVDRLAADDRRACVVDVPPPLAVLLVDGAPSDRIEDDEVGLLGAVLEPVDGDAPGSAQPFHVRTVEPDQLARGDVSLADWDVVVLANVEAPGAPLVRALEERVAAGGGLWIALGDRVDPDRWNAQAWRPDQSGLLPAELGARREVSERQRDYWRVASFAEEHPALAFFSDERWRGYLTEVPVYAFLSVRPQAGARVLARLDDDDQSPLLVERRYDRGRVFLWTSTLDRAWTLLPELPRTLVPLAHETLRYLGRPPGADYNLSVGEPITAESEVFPRSPLVELPDGSQKPLDGEAEPAGPQRWRLPAFEHTERAGLYRVAIEGERALPFAVRIDPREGDLERISGGELAGLHPALRLVAAGSDEGDGGDDPARGELWRGLALVALLFLTGESLWAAFLGRRRGRAA